MGYIKLLGGFLLLFIFSIAIVSYVINFTNDNSSYTTLDSDFNDFRTEVRGNATSYITEINQSSDNIFTSTVTEGSQTIVTGQGLKGGIFKLYTIMGSIFDLARDKLFGGDSQFVLILSLITSFVLFVLAVYFIKMWIGANPD